MSQFIEWLGMGGYGWYVWSSYALGLLIIVLNIYLPLRHHRLLLKRSVFGKATAGNGE